MGAIVSQPTDKQTPDATLGGDAANTPTNTGHAITDAVVGIGASAFSCRWFAFPAFPAAISSATLRVTHVSEGLIVGDGLNSFTLSYSTDNGSNWTAIVSRSNFTASQNVTSDVALPLSLDASQLQVRDHATASAATGDAGATVTISGIQVTLTYPDGGGVVG